MTASITQTRQRADEALDGAIDWMVLLQSGEASAADEARLAAWCQADTRHAQAWAQVRGALQRSLAPVLDIPTQEYEQEGREQGRNLSTGAPSGLRNSGAAAGAARAALLLAPRRRALHKLLALVGVGAATAWSVRHTAPAALLLADVRTGTAERRSVQLPDGSTLVLNARSAVDIDFTAAARTLHLRTGEIIVTAAPDAARPLVVRSAQGSVQALGTRFLVRQAADSTVAMVIEHSVRVRNLSGREHRLEQGDAVTFDGDGITPLAGPQATALAQWERGMLLAHDRPLGEVIEALRPYRDGFIRISPAAARLRVLGAFPLADADRAIESLAQTLPIRVAVHGRWLVAIDVADGS